MILKYLKEFLIFIYSNKRKHITSGGTNSFFTEENDLILDLGSGTGSGALSSLTLKRNCISFEKNEDQFKFSIAKI